MKSNHFETKISNFWHRSMNPSRFDNFLDPLKFSLSSFGEADIFSKPSDWANFWNLNRCDVRIDIFERILDVHQEFCDVQSRQILTIKLKNLEYRQFSMWQKWWKMKVVIWKPDLTVLKNKSLDISRTKRGIKNLKIGFCRGRLGVFDEVKILVNKCCLKVWVFR